MSGKEGFSIVLYGDNAYTKEELTSHGLPESLSKQDILELSKIRYALSTNSFKKYMAVTIASNISEKSVAAIRENQDVYKRQGLFHRAFRRWSDETAICSVFPGRTYLGTCKAWRFDVSSENG